MSWALRDGPVTIPVGATKQQIKSAITSANLTGDDVIDDVAAVNAMREDLGKAAADLINGQPMGAYPCRVSVNGQLRQLYEDGGAKHCGYCYVEIHAAE